MSNAPCAGCGSQYDCEEKCPLAAFTEWVGGAPPEEYAGYLEGLLAVLRPGSETRAQHGMGPEGETAEESEYLTGKCDHCGETFETLEGLEGHECEEG